MKFLLFSSVLVNVLHIQTSSRCFSEIIPWENLNIKTIWAIWGVFFYFSSLLFYTQVISNMDWITNCGQTHRTCFNSWIVHFQVVVRLFKVFVFRTSLRTNNSNVYFRGTVLEYICHITQSWNKFRRFGMSLACHYVRVPIWTPYDQNLKLVKS